MHKKLLRAFVFIIALCFFNPSFGHRNRMAVGRDGMSVSAQAIATRVSDYILRQGGNAVDAAVAMGYALAVVHPCCGNLGGGGFMLIHLADGKNVFVNFREKAPQHITQSMLAHNTRATTKEAYRTVGVPGTVMALNSVLKRYGTLPLTEVIQPAIKLAENGYKLTKDDIQFLSYEVDHLKDEPNVAAIFLKQDRPFRPGERLVQNDLADTLRRIAEGGTKAFYRGDIAKRIVKASQRHGGVLTTKDFSNYSIEFKKPLECTYRGYQVITSPPPSSGGAAICEMLNIAEGFPLHKLGPHSVETIHDNIEAMRFTYADKLKYIGDPSFVHAPLRKLISKNYARKLRRQIKPHTAGRSIKLGSPHRNEGENTTSYVVVDRAGNVVVVTYSINDFFWRTHYCGQHGLLT